MKVAVTHENGQIFGHFGHTETFKVYEIENGQIVSSQVVGTDFLSTFIEFHTVSHVLQ